jgi:hypothetical protein
LASGAGKLYLSGGCPLECGKQRKSQHPHVAFGIVQYIVTVVSNAAATITASPELPQKEF